LKTAILFQNENKRSYLMARTLEARARSFLPLAELCQCLFREVWLNSKQSVLFTRAKENDTWVWKVAEKFPSYKETDARAMLPNANDIDVTAQEIEICFPDESTRTFYRKQTGTKNGTPVFTWTRQNKNT
jgi:hypothetical protein